VIGFKTPEREATRAVRQALKPYRRMLTRFTPQGQEQGAVTVVFTGINDRDELIQQVQDSVRYMAFAGSLSDTNQTGAAAQRNIPAIGFRWDTYFDWDGRGQMPAAEFAQLQTLGRAVQASGRRVNIWSAPDTHQCWRTQRAAGIRTFVTDRPAALSDWYRNYETSERPFSK
jgi:hypothetical protein